MVIKISGTARPHRGVIQEDFAGRLPDHTLFTQIFGKDEPDEVGILSLLRLFSVLKVIAAISNRRQSHDLKSQSAWEIATRSSLNLLRLSA